MRTSLSISASVVVLALLAGCGGSGDDKSASQDPAASDPSTSAPTTAPTTAPSSAPTTTPTPTPTAPPKPAGPLTQAQYQTALIRLDQRLDGDISALGRVKTEDSLTAAMENLTQTLNAESLALGSIKPPARAVAANRVLQLRLKAAATALASGDTSDVGCGGLAFVSQSVQRQLTTTLSRRGHVQSKKTATVYRIGGGYSLYVKSGKDWNPKRRQFSSDCSFKKFDQSFSRNTGWEIQLKPSILGNATSTAVDPY